MVRGVLQCQCNLLPGVNSTRKKASSTVARSFQCRTDTPVHESSDYHKLLKAAQLYNDLKGWHKIVLPFPKSFAFDAKHN